MRIGQLLGVGMMFAVSRFVYANGGTNGNLPEPETLALLGVGAVALMVARWRNKK